MRSVGIVRSGWLWAMVAGAACVQACDSGSGTALFGDAAAGAGAGSSGGNASQGGSSGAKPNGGGSGAAGSANAGSLNGGSTQGGVGEQPNGGTGAEPSGGASDGGVPGGGEAGQGGVATGEAGQGGMAEGGGPGDPTCDRVLVSVEPRVQNVVFLVDRSGTMFDVNSEPWTAVKEASLTAIQEMQSELAIGFVSVTGEAESCPLLDEVAVALDNHAAIAAKYHALAKPAKGESPFMLGLTRAGEMIANGPGTGDAFVLMVIDGEPDYCGDGNPLCPIDSVVARIQGLYGQGVATVVAGLPNLTTPAQHATALQTYASAGRGFPVAPVGDTASNLYYQCSGTAGWAQEFAASGKQAPSALGRYSSGPAFTAPYTSLDPTAGSAALTAAFRSAFASIKSCRFDIADHLVNGNLASTGVVEVDGQAVAFSVNGWQLADSATIELHGEACDAWRTPGDKEISVDFPCSALLE